MRTPKNPQAAADLRQMPKGVQATLMQYSDCLRAARKGMKYRNAYGEAVSSGGWAGNAIDPEFSTTGEHWELLEPTAAQREAAVQLGRTLTKVMVTGSTRRRVRSEHGPGEVQNAVLVRGMAALSRREVPDWRGLYRNRRMAESPRTPLQVGFLLDTSFSMDAMSVAGATLSWIVAEATRKVSGKIATVAFGYEAWPLAAPGEYLPLIPHLTMFGGQHKATEAFEQVDSILNLTDGDGARLLVVFTDGQYSGSEPWFGKYLAEAARSGVAVIVLSDRQPAILDFPLPGTAKFVNLARELSAIQYANPDPEVWAELASILSEQVVEAIEEAKKELSH